MTKYLLLLIALCAATSCSQKPINTREPTALNFSGPAFEGWYMRLTDENGKRSYAVIGGSFIKDKSKITERTFHQGYLGILVSEGDGAPTLSYEAFPEKTHFTTNEMSKYGTKELTGTSKFYWEAEGFGSISQDEIKIGIKDEVYISATMKKRLPWDNVNDEIGPEGEILYVPFVPVHWFVHSLGSNTKYNGFYRIGDDVTMLNSKGYTHIEKNWGNAFPKGWIWSQAIGPGNMTQFALAGGIVEMPGVPAFESWLIGIRGNKTFWDFRASNLATVFKTKIDSCNGIFEIDVSDRRRLAKIRAKSSLDSFGKVSIPTVSGFKKNGGVESFSANIEITTYEKDNNDTFIEKEYITFKNAALEFGAGYMCK